jgi:predicted metal-dependent enzyme (double-stranded beta helix superfamily)
MGYTLEKFCADCRKILTSQVPQVEALSQVAARLGQLLANPAFVADTFSDDMPPGRRVLHHDPDTDVYVLAHVQAAGKGGAPHSHGASWAIYGTAGGYTDMIEWRRTNPDSEEQAQLEAVDRYRLEAGQTRAYGPDVIHSTAHPQKAWVIRVTGTDLDAIPRYRFSPKRDKILEKSAE